MRRLALVAVAATAAVWAAIVIAACDVPDPLGWKGDGSPTA